LFSIGTTTIKNWKRLRAQTEKLEGQGRPCNPYKIDTEALKSYIRERPDAFLNEIASHFGVTAPAIHTAMKRMNITRGKRPTKPYCLCNLIRLGVSKNMGTEYQYFY
jgi:hypothetical protein